MRLTLGLAGLVVPFLALGACDSSKLAGTNAKKAKSGSGSGPHGDDDDSHTGSSGTGSPGTGSPSDGAPGTGGNPENAHIPAIPPGAIDEGGGIKKECKETLDLPTSTVGLAQLWHWEPTAGFPDFKEVTATPIVGPLKKGDPTPFVIAVGFAECLGTVAQPAHLFAINGKTGAQAWASDLTVHAWISPALGDIDLDGGNEIVAFGMDGFIHALDGDGKEKWVSKVPAFDSPSEKATNWPQGLSVADLDGDGKPEVIAGLLVLDGATGAKKFAIDAGGGHTVVGDYDGEKGLEIVTGTGVYSGADGHAICKFATPVDEPAIAHMKAGAATASVIGVINKTDIAIYSGKDCGLVGTAKKSSPGGGPINISDFDGDGALDFGTAGLDDYMAFDASGKSLWSKPTQDHSSQVTGSTTFDFNGDGKNEVVYADEIKLRIFNGVDGALIYEAPHSSYTARETPVVADVDGDGTANVVVGSNACLTGSTQHGIYAYKEPNNKWVGTRPIWNQHAYDPLLVSASGSLVNVDVESIYKPWLSAAYLVGFRNNVPKPAIKKDCK